ncbi:glycosyltransferase family protein [Oceanisphaera avium]|uniref:Uncharacterized protein n=1 Tax=Oceanisphaera avium TaxID=1903694 RepID=A0A1Y0CV59_9GAMM|nr:hypothetical protein [Oceanisphaera avium]ART78816.1 hypothetical protein CBP12_00475 [Oceanisphaera avium]
MLNIIVLVSKEDLAALSAVNLYEECLGDINDSLFAEQAKKSLLSVTSSRKIIFVTTKYEAADYCLADTFNQLDHSAVVCELHDETKGPIFSALMSLDNLDLDKPLIIINFCQIGDIKALTDKHLKLDAAKFSAENSSKNSYYFSTASLFVDAAKDVIRKKYNSEQPLDLAEMLTTSTLANKRLKHVEVPFDRRNPQAAMHNIIIDNTVNG